MDITRFIKNYSENTRIDPAFGVGVASLGKLLGTKRIGVNVVILPPGTRSSDPHAESLEEEFGYVVSGSPTLWIDGETVQLQPGHGFGFPSGTGICHSVINESLEPAVILAIGERTKAASRLTL